MNIGTEQEPNLASSVPPQSKAQTKRTLTGRLCGLRRRRRHAVLVRANPRQFVHLGLELMFGVRLAKCFRAPLYVIRPDQVVNTALYDLVVDNVTIKVVKGWRARVLTWMFFSGSALNVKDKTVPYASPLGYLLTYRFFRLNRFVAKGFWNRLAPVLNQGKRYIRALLLKYKTTPRLPTAAAPVVRRDITVQAREFICDPGKAEYTTYDSPLNNSSLAVERPPDIQKTKPTRLNPSYGRRLWVDDVGLFRIPEDRLRGLSAKAEKEFGILPGKPLVVLHMREPGFKAGREIHEQKPFKGRDDSTRNVTFSNYLQAMDYLREHGDTRARLSGR